MTLVQHELQNAYIGQRVDVTSLTLDKNSITLNTAGDTEQITATVVPSGTPITWSSSDTSVATVSSTGLVTCVTPGTATITAEAFGVTATCEVSGGGRTPGANTIAYYPLETDTKDYSGNSRNGTNNGVTFSNGLATFNGSSYVNLGSGSWTNIKTNMTISAWFKWNGSYVYDEGNIIISKCKYYMPLTSDSYYILQVDTANGTRITAGFNNGSDYNSHPLNFRTNGGGSPTLGPVAQSNKWYNLVLTNDGTTKKAYIDGALYATETSNSTNTTTSIDLIIGGAVYYNHHGYFNGNISAVILEDKTWTATEVSDYYNQTKGNYGLGFNS